MIYGIYRAANQGGFKLYDRLKKIVPNVRQLGYPTTHTLYEWINQKEATGGKFPDIEPLGISKRHLKVKMNHEGFSAEHKLKILKRCFCKCHNKNVKKRGCSRNDREIRIEKGAKII